MSVPLQLQLFDAFLGTQEGIHSVILPDIFSPGGSKNLYIDKFARAKKISGYTKQNASAVTTNTGASACMGRSLQAYRSISGGTVTRQLLCAFDDQTNEFELWYSTNDGASWTFIADLGSGSINSVPDWSQFGNTLYFANGVVSPKKWDGSSWTTAGRTQSPTITSAAGAAGALSGHYKWKLVSMIGGERQAASAGSTSLNLQDLKGSLTWTADSNVSVTGYELYRTTGSGEVYYYVDYIDLRTTASYTDNATDLSILENRVLTEHGDPPPTAYYVEPHKQRMWWAKTDTYPTRAWWSDPGLAEDVLAENYLDFSDGETIGDQITGMFGNIEGKLTVFTERAVWTVSGTGQVIGNIVDWTRIKTNAQIGAVSHRTAVRVPAGAKYADSEGKIQQTAVVALAYLTPLNDIRLFDGDNDIVISNPVRTTCATMNYAQRAKAFAVPNRDLGEIAWVFPSGSSGEPDECVVWNYRWGVWYTRDWAFGHAIEVETSSDASILLGSSSSTATGGYVYKLNDGTSFDGTAIDAKWMTKTLYGVTPDGQPAISNQKRYRWVDFLFETEQTSSLTVEWLVGGAPDNGAAISSKTVSPASETIVSSDGSTIITSDGSTLVAGQASTSLRVLLQDSGGGYLHDEGVRLRVGDNASNGSWSIEAMTLAYQIMPGLQRRMQG